MSTKNNPHIWTEATRQERITDMREMRQQGCSLESIGQKYNLSRERVRQLVGDAYSPVHIGFKTHEHYMVYSRFIVGLLEGGTSLKSITLLTGLSRSVLRRMASEAGYVFRKLNKELLFEGQRRCSRCHEVKDLKEFGRNAKSKFGLSRVCKPCNRLNSRMQYLRRKVPEDHAQQDERQPRQDQSAAGREESDL